MRSDRPLSPSAPSRRSVRALVLAAGLLVVLQGAASAWLAARGPLHRHAEPTAPVMLEDFRRVAAAHGAGAARAREQADDHPGVQEDTHADVHAVVHADGLADAHADALAAGLADSHADALADVLADSHAVVHADVLADSHAHAHAEGRRHHHAFDATAVPVAGGAPVADAAADESTGAQPPFLPWRSEAPRLAARTASDGATAAAASAGWRSRAPAPPLRPPRSA